MRLLYASVLALALGACSLPPLKLDDIATEQRLLSSDAVDVSISPAEFERVDVHEDMLYSQKIETGVFWKRAFIGTASDRSFTIHSAVLKTSYEAAGFVGRYTYIVNGELNLPGKSYSIHAEGTRAAGYAFFQAQKQAVELGIKSAADQCMEIMERHFSKE